MYVSKLTSSQLTAISVQNYIDPGAGLKQLGDWFQDSDLIFDSLFMPGTAPTTDNAVDASFLDTDIPIQPTPMVRTYASDNAMLVLLTPATRAQT